MNNQDQPYAYLARPHWERDYTDKEGLLDEPA